MADHACDGAFGGSSGPESIAVEFASDNDLMASCADGALESLDRRGTDARFDEDRFDLAFRNEVSEVGHGFGSGFGGGVDSLDGMDFQSEGASKVGKGIVGGDENAVIGRDFVDFAAKLGGEAQKLALDLIRSRMNQILGVRAFLGESVGEWLDGFRPNIGAVPDVGIEFIFFRDEELVGGHGGSDGEAFLGKIFEDGCHAAFEMESVEEDQVGIVEAGDIAGGGSVKVGIDSRPHQGDDFDLFSSEAPSKIGDHSGGGHDPKLLFALKRARQAPAEQEPNQNQSEEAELTQSYPRLQKLAKANFRRSREAGARDEGQKLAKSGSIKQKNRPDPSGSERWLGPEHAQSG